MQAINKSLCNLNNNNLTFKLFGVDIAPNKNLNVHLIEINKGPDMSPKDNRDGSVKFKVLEDIFEKIGVINFNHKNDYKLIWEN